MNNILDFLNNNVKKNIINNSKQPEILTGFETFDKKTLGLFGGMYVIGGMSQTGKTAIMVQIMNKLAKDNIYCIYFTLEDTKQSLIQRGLINESFKNKSNGLNPFDFIKNTNEQLINETIENYSKYADKIQIISREEMKIINHETIRQYIDVHQRRIGKRVVVFIDYLQIMDSCVEKDVRLKTAENISRLTQCAKEFNIPIFTCSTLNRISYDQDVKLSSFCESSAIEYSSDMCLGLKMRGNSEKQVLENSYKEIRPIVFSVIKNKLPGGKLFKYNLEFDSIKCEFRETNKEIFLTDKVIEDNDLQAKKQNATIDNSISMFEIQQ